MADETLPSGRTLASLRTAAKAAIDRASYRGTLGEVRLQPKDVLALLEMAAAATVASQTPMESWTEYGLRWLERNPDAFIQGQGASTVRVWADNRSSTALDETESASHDWARDGYPNELVERDVAAGSWRRP